MAFALIFVGILFTVASVRGKQSDLFALLKSDFTGQGNFLYWAIAVVAVGAIGYITPLRRLSQALLALIVIVLILKRGDPTAIGGGVFTRIFNDVTSATGQSITILTPQSGRFNAGTDPLTGETTLANPFGALIVN